MLLLTSLVPKLPQERLHVVLVLVTEAVLGTKEVSEKARNAAYDLLVALGNKMAEGGTISQSLMAGSNEVQTNEEKAEGEDAGDDAEMQPAADGSSPFAERYTVKLTRLTSYRQHRGVHQDRSRRDGWNDPAYDQCHHYSIVQTDIRVPR
jgi:hypothetical protein